MTIPRNWPHRILGISDDATLAEATLAYKRLAQKYHPDKPGGSSEKFQALGKALKEFTRLTPCVLCEGKGVIRVRNGLGVKTENCPKCWNFKE